MYQLKDVIVDIPCSWFGVVWLMDVPNGLVYIVDVPI